MRRQQYAPGRGRQALGEALDGGDHTVDAHHHARAAAGLLEGRRATTHPAYAELLKRLGVEYVRDYSVEDGKFLTMAGVSGGIDTTLGLVAKLRSEGAAKLIQTDIEYDPQPPFGGLDWGEADGDRLVQTLEEHRMDLEQALAGRPDLYQKLFG